MTISETEEGRVEQLLGIINLYPAIRIMHFSDSDDILTKKIYELCSKSEYEYQINSIDKASSEELTNRYGELPYIKIKHINLKQPRYATQAKLYDYLFVTSDIDSDSRDSFVQKCYGAIKNAGLFILFIPKDDMREYHQWSELLSEHNFVAINKLDTFSYSDVVIAKKMHGWGG
ncbi:hypothetical protein MNB_SV-6-349 [hydrothermal vent metagenome]|uniref:Uncharacterized protein n=1 Tax=hydrothermal vent metagenome TaxID=652676 RepID=A0A1W1C8H9_9ZZZZ